MDNSLQHHGILGQKWGVRRFQNADGTLTNAGKKRYKGQEIADRVHEAYTKSADKSKARVGNTWDEKPNKEQPWNEKPNTVFNRSKDYDPTVKSITTRKERNRMSEQELDDEIKRLEKEVRLHELEQRNTDAGKKFVEDVMKDAGKRILVTAAVGTALYGLKVATGGKIPN